MYQDLYGKAKKIMKQDACMKFYDALKPLYLEIDASGIILQAELFQVREGMNCGSDEVPDNVTLHLIAFASKSMSSAEWQSSNIAWKALGIFHGLGKLYCYCFAKEVYVITDHKPLVAMVNTDVAQLSQQLQCIMLHIHQYSMYIFYKPGPRLYTLDWLSHNNHTENRNQEMTGMNINIHMISTAAHIQICMSIEDIRTA